MGRSGSLILAATLVALWHTVTGTASRPAADIRVPEDYATIQAALDAAVDGDRVLVAAGTYVGHLDFHGKDIDLVSTSGAASTILRPPGDPFDFDSIVTAGPAGSISGFTITGGTAQVGGGILVNGAGTEIRDNVFEDNNEKTGGFGAAIGGNGASPVIERNIFRRNNADAQNLSGVITLVNCSSPYIANNLFYDNPTRALNMTLPQCAHPVVVNNTLVANQVGIFVAGQIGLEPQDYRNNLIFGNLVGMQVSFYSGEFPCVWENNLVYGNDVDYGGCPDQTGLAGNISEMPLLVDPGAHDYHLLAGSPAIDSGSAAEAPPTDYDGTARPLDGNADGTAAFDIGAYEFNGEAIVYDLCIQDDRTRDILKLNSTTGNYQFTSCLTGTTIIGLGVVRRQGSCTLQFSASGQSTVTATCYVCRHRAQALVRITGGGSFRLTDSDTTDNTCLCPT